VPRQDIVSEISCTSKGMLVKVTIRQRYENAQAEKTPYRQVRFL
jgi:hypothetical protein